MEGLSRRSSGIYFARLVVPKRLRVLVGRSELIASTGVRDLALARIVAGQILVGWRERLLELEKSLGGASFDLSKLVLGSPELLSRLHVPLSRASAASGIPEDALLSEASAGRMHLYVRVATVKGFRVPVTTLELDRPADGGPGGFVVPIVNQMPASAFEEVYSGVLGLLEPTTAAELALAGKPWIGVAFAPQGARRHVFVPDDPIAVGRHDLLVLGSQVEAFRRRVAVSVTDEQLAATRATLAPSTGGASADRLRLLKESIDKYLSDHPRARRADETRRVRASCELFLELMGGDLRGCDLTRDVIRRFRDAKLTKVPSHENKVRLKYRTETVSASMAAVAGTDWPPISAPQQAKHFDWVCRWIDWLGANDWADRDLADGVRSGGDARRAVRKLRNERTDRERRDPFNDSTLAKIFGASWFRTGRGEQTKGGTYRTWMPYRYWIPLIGLYTGARISEAAQLSLDDLKSTALGVGLFRFEGHVGDAPRGAKHVKNVNSRRTVPVHPKLVDLGLLRYADRLRSEGYSKLFPELTPDRVKGYGKRPTQWFSQYLASLGIERDGTQVFHSFRHTLSTRLAKSMNLSPALTGEILGHKRGDSIAEFVYGEDEKEFDPSSPIVKAIREVTYSCTDGLASIDIEAGLKAVSDALRRKKTARPGGRRASA